MKIFSLDQTSSAIPVESGRGSRKAPGFNGTRPNERHFPSSDWSPGPEGFLSDGDLNDTRGVHVFQDLALYDAFWKELEPSLLEARRPAGRGRFPSAHLHSAVFGELLDQRLTDLGLQAVGAHILVQEGNQDSSTFDPSTGSYVGLHADFMTVWGWENRHVLDRRMVFNLGAQPRGLVLVDSTLKELRDQLIDGGDADPCLFKPGPTPIFVEHVMAKLSPEFLRIHLPPGHGAIFPAQDLIHDGNTKALTDLDIFINCLVASL